MKDLPVLKGNIIHLRALHLEDAQGNYPNWLNDPEVTKYNSHGDVFYTREMAEDYIRNVHASQTAHVFAIVNNASHQHLGNISLQAIDMKARNAEFAILIGEPSVYGKGIGEEAGKLLIDYGFNHLHLHRIYCGTSSKNHGMQKLAAKLGMKQEGIRRDGLLKNGEYADIIEYGMLDNDTKETL